LEGIAPIQERLEGFFPYMNAQQEQQVSLLVGPGGPAASGGQVSHSWRFTDDAGWSLVIGADTATLAVGPEYSEFAEFSDRFRSTLIALGEGAGVTRANRLGIRYVNVADTVPTEPDAWRSWFRSDLNGWSVTDIVAENTRLVTSITQTQLSATATADSSGPPIDIQAMVRHGFIPPNTMVPGVLPRLPQTAAAYLLDIDLYVEVPQAFDGDELTRQLTVLHDQIDRFFYWSMTPEGAEYFGVEVLQ
jgi:uncharacterized protein (TIGR04255 family)